MKKGWVWYVTAAAAYASKELDNVITSGGSFKKVA
jgi:hypothetical protein